MSKPEKSDYPGAVEWAEALELYVAELEAEVESLKCCGSCKRVGWVSEPEAFLTLRCLESNSAVELEWRCGFTPSRWTRRVQT